MAEITLSNGMWIKTIITSAAQHMQTAIMSTASSWFFPQIQVAKKNEPTAKVLLENTKEKHITQNIKGKV